MISLADLFIQQALGTPVVYNVCVYICCLQKHSCLGYTIGSLVHCVLALCQDTVLGSEVHKDEESPFLCGTCSSPVKKTGVLPPVMKET